MLKKKKEGKKKPGKLHVEIAQGNWERLKAHVEAYNQDEGRVTPEIKPVHVINQALLEYLSEGDA